MRTWSCGMVAGMAVMLGVAGPAAAFDGGTPAPEGNGGVEYSAPLARAAASPPVATVFRLRPAVVTGVGAAQRASTLVRRLERIVSTLT